ncbi:carbohydrate-binding family 9-like protein [Halorarum halophilum]|uniref:Carbohydrate-binding family 9-like protein n=1 Tax=Halorarum halophilum TaxID=2743090 RepID=A0A7D5GMW0_9EURY|nr:carbohydrate-binding family 9-like protein [Halobaculum halophilum]QLG28844.1 carbohydrate-binding family 9-like protein [Halobaculum halophilum]
MRTYEVRYEPDGVQLSGEVNGTAWDRAKAGEIDRFSWSDDGDGPGTVVRALHDEDALFLQFQVEDREMRAEVTELNGPTFEDSSVEFFATPGPDAEGKYLNFEANCCGTFKLGWQEPAWRERGVGRDLVSPMLAGEIDVETSVPGPTRTPSEDDNGWWLAVRIPEATLQSFTGRPVSIAHDAVWRGNFYRSGVPDHRKATWNPLPTPTPEYHSPEHFGRIRFE